MNNRKNSRAAARRRKRQLHLSRLSLLIMLLVLAVGLFFGVRAVLRGLKGWVNQVMSDETEEPSRTEAGTDETGSDPSETETAAAPDYSETLEKAKYLALTYDYEAAIKLLETIRDYQVKQDVMDCIREYEDAMTTLSALGPTDVYHVFFHSLIVDTDVAFNRSGSYYRDAFNNTMTSVYEFRLMLEKMYEGGWVLVKMHDMAYTDENGNFKAGTIMLPPGKKAFVLSIDDVSYYEYMKDCGGTNVNAFASKLVIDENGDVKNEFINRDGSVSVGDYDVISILETFLKEHPDFSYRGAKGVVALTGYDGILGYRTDAKYEYSDDPEWQRLYAADWAANEAVYRTINRNEEREKAAAVAARMKELGWEFASHTWGHVNVETNDLARIRWDNEMWQEQVNSLLNYETDIIIFAFGSDLADWHPYTPENAKFAYLHDQGFKYYCNVSTYELPNTWVQFSSQYGYLRQARANLDGYAMWKEITKDPDGRLDVFFEAESVFDPARPTPVIFVS